MKFSWTVALGCLLGILIQLPSAWQYRQRILAGGNDFLMFYAGARLAGTRDLYNIDRVHEVQRESAGMSGEVLIYTRLPYVAVLISPLGRLPYRTAYAVWQLLSVAALTGFLALWRPPGFATTLLFSCFSMPLFAGFVNAQDTTFLLLWIALAVFLLRRGSPFAAGLIFSLCAAKYQLFLLLPVLILGQRLWRFAMGLITGGAALLAVSFLTAGLNWPREYLAMLADPRALAAENQMVNLHGLFFRWQHGWMWEGILALSVVAATWRIVRRGNFDFALAATLLGGVLLSIHAYVNDAVILLPAILVIYSFSASTWMKVLALILAAPVGYILALSTAFPWTALVPLAALVLLYSMAVDQALRPNTAYCPPRGRPDSEDSTPAARA